MFSYLYHYKSLVTRVYDGDTITCDIDLGHNLWMRKQKIRLAGIDAPEIRGKSRPEGLQSREALSKLILDEFIVLETIRDNKGKYGRLLGKVWLPQKNGEWLDVNKFLVDNGLAEVYLF